MIARQRPDASLHEMLACVNREIQMRHKVYAGQVDRGKMRPETAEREIELMIAVRNTLESLCPVTMERHRIEIVGVTPSCIDCSSVLQKMEGDEIAEWKCLHCGLSNDELRTMARDGGD